MRLHYKLGKDHAVEPCQFWEWVAFMETPGADRVAADEMGDIRVSTVFMGLNYSIGDGPPRVFETMIFGGVHNHYQRRYSTWDEAVAGHAEALALAKAGAN